MDAFRPIVELNFLYQSGTLVAGNGGTATAVLYAYITNNTPAPLPVPLPTGMWMMLSGVMGLGAKMHRRRAS